MRKASRKLVLDPNGFVHVAGDGIARSYDGEGNVIDHHVLNNAQLLGHAADMFGDSETGRYLQHIWANVDGNNVPEEHRMNPPDSLKPEQFRAGKEDQTPNEARQVEDELLGKRATPPRCYKMFCHDTNSCRVAGCYACIQTEVQWREKKCILRPAWYPQPFPLVNFCGKKGKRSAICARGGTPQ